MTARLPTNVLERSEEQYGYTPSPSLHYLCLASLSGTSDSPRSGGNRTAGGKNGRRRERQIRGGCYDRRQRQARQPQSLPGQLEYPGNARWRNHAPCMMCIMPGTYCFLLFARGFYGAFLPSANPVSDPRFYAGARLPIW